MDVLRPQIETAVHILYIFILRSSETFINEREFGEKRFTFIATFQCGILKTGFSPIYSLFSTNYSTVQLDMTDCEEWEYPIQGREYRRHRLGCNPHTQVYMSKRTGTLQTVSF